MLPTCLASDARAPAGGAGKGDGAAAQDPAEARQQRRSTQSSGLQQKLRISCCAGKALLGQRPVAHIACPVMLHT